MEANQSWAIYGLTDPRSGAVRYIGWSANPQRRYSSHISAARRERTYKAHWIMALLARGLRPGLVILETGQGPGWAEAERRQIAAYRAAGARLTNASDGGDGAPGVGVAVNPGPLSPSHRARLSESMPHRRLTLDQAREARRLYQAGGYTHRALAALFGTDKKTMGAIIRGERYPDPDYQPPPVLSGPRGPHPAGFRARLSESMPHRRLTTDQAREARRLYQAGGYTHRALAALFGVDKRTIGAIVRGERYPDPGE